MNQMTQNSNCEHWRFEVEHATSRSPRFPTLLNVFAWAGNKYYVFLKTLNNEIGGQTLELWLNIP